MASDSRKIRYAVVGLGHITQAAVLPALARAERSELAALVSGNPEKLEAMAQRYGIRNCVSYDEYDRLLRSGDVDAVYVAVPNHLHCDYAVRAAEAGVHVLCEKPFAVTVEECDRIIAASERHRTKLMVAYRLHFERANLEAVDAVLRGDLGEVKFLAASFSQNVRAGDVRLMATAQGGGPLYDMGVYCINAARYLFRDEPVEVKGTTTTSDDERFEDCEETVSAILRFPGGGVASFSCSFGAAETASYRLVGTKGVIVMEDAFEYGSKIRYELSNEEQKRRARFAKRDQFGPEIDYFSRCILEDRQPEMGGEEGRADVAIIRAILESAARSRAVAVEIGPVKPRPDLRLSRFRPGFEKPDEIQAASPKS